MKKILTFSLIFLFLAAGASAQELRDHDHDRDDKKFHKHGLTRRERKDLRRDAIRLDMTEHRIHSDGVVTPMEHKRVMRQKRDIRRDAFLYRHNRRHRI